MNNIELKSFSSELEKDAQIATMVAQGAKFLGGLLKSTKAGTKLLGYSDEIMKASKNGADGAAGLTHIKKYDTAKIFRGSKGELTASAAQPNAGFIQNRVGDAASYLGKLQTGISGNKSLTENAGQFLKNTWSAEKDLYRNARYKTVAKDSAEVVGGKVKTKAPGPLKYIFRDRKILGTGQDGSYIIKKRLLPQVAGYSFTPSGMVASGAALGMSPKESIQDAALWTPVTRPIGELKMIKDLLL